MLFALIYIFILLLIISLSFWGLSSIVKLKIFKRLIWIHVANLPLVLVFFIYEIMHDKRNFDGPGVLGLFMVLFNLPVCLPILLLPYLILFIILTKIVDKLGNLYHQEWKLLYSLFIVTTLFNILFDILWWKYIYTDQFSNYSIIFSNIFLCISVWLPVSITVFLEHRDKRKISS